MAEITVARALKYKNRVIERMRKLELDIRSGNSVLQGGERDIDIQAAMRERLALEQHLIALKLQLQTVNAPINESIARLQELKARITFLEEITTTHGKVDARRTMFGEAGEVSYEAVLRKPQIDEMLVAAKNELDTLQEGIDRFNNTTKFVTEILPLQ